MIQLVLFDIDGTLVRTGGAGTRAMTMAFADVFGIRSALAGVSVSGRTDAWILGDVALRHGLEPSPTEWQRLRLAYFDFLGREVRHPGARKGVLPGVRRLLDVLSGRRVALALLTGNAEQGARIKLEHFDLWRYFPWGAFGDVTDDRNALLAEALERVRTSGGPDARPADVVVVGDTPFDVAVAVAGGARSVAVATGSHDPSSLAASGASVVLDDLGDLEATLRALGVGEAAQAAGS